MSKFAYWKLSTLLLAAYVVVNFQPLIGFGLMCAGGDNGHCGG